MSILFWAVVIVDPCFGWGYSVNVNPGFISHLFMKGGYHVLGGKTPNQKSGSISPGLTLMRIIWHESACLKFERNPRNFCISCNVLLLLSAIHGKSILATV